MSQTLLKALQNPDLYDHPVSGFTLIETHISWVLLTGEFVYKVKKPVNFGFLDFSSLEQRKHFCAEEVRLNRRLAPDLYLGVVSVHGTETAPSLNSDGPAIEYMVKTRQFEQTDLLGNLQRAGALTAEHIDSLAAKLAQFHLHIDHAPADSPWGEPDNVHAPVADNFNSIRPLLSDADDQAQLDQLEQWAHTTFQRLIPQLAQRKADGFVRECHGDTYLDNVTLIKGEVTLFDGIEFNDAFRWTDVMADVAFMVMDLEDRGLIELAQRFLNAYMEHTGDYAGLALLDYYSTVALHLVEQLGAIRIRSDVERKRLFGNQGAGEMNSGLYSAERSTQTYERLASLAGQILAAGYPVVVDATHLKQAQRDTLRQAIKDQGAPCLILQCSAPLDTIESWMEVRRQQGRDPSDGDISVAREQLLAREALTGEEQASALQVETDSTDSIALLVSQLRQRF